MRMSLDGENLAGKRYVTVLVRLIVDPQGPTPQGEVLSLAGRPQGRFRGWRDLIQVLQAVAAASPVPLATLAEAGLSPTSG